MFNSFSWDWSSQWLLILTLLLVILIKNVASRRGSGPPLPPGPTFTFPLLGHLPLLGKWPHLTLARLAQRYGPIFKLRLGSTFVVVLSSYEAVNNTLKMKGDIFSDRPLNNPFAFTSPKSLASTNGWQWNQHRRFFDKYLKQAGVGSCSSEESIMEEVQYFLNRCEQLRQLAGGVGTGAIDMEKDLAISVANNTCLLVFGRRFDYDDPKFQQLIEDENEMTRLYNTVGVSFFMPKLARLLGPLGLSVVIKEIKNLGRKFDAFSSEVVKDHGQRPSDYLKDDYISTFASEKKRRSLSSDTEEVFTDTWLEGILHSLYGGGVETAFNVLQFAILAMIRQPDLQEKIHRELDQVIGSRAVTLSDRRSTPLTWATLLEVLRIITPLPLSVPRSNREEMIFEGYRIPKNSYIIPNLWYIHHDPKLWKDPESFRPERFIENGEVVKVAHLIPFGVGKRSCPGEVLGNAEMYLYFASMMQRFEYRSPVDIQQLPLLQAYKPSLVLSCLPYKVILTPRNL